MNPKNSSIIKSESLLVQTKTVDASIDNQLGNKKQEKIYFVTRNRMKPYDIRPELFTYRNLASQTMPQSTPHKPIHATLLNVCMYECSCSPDEVNSLLKVKTDVRMLIDDTNEQLTRSRPDETDVRMLIDDYK
jgi:hypothetical protein